MILIPDKQCVCLSGIVVFAQMFLKFFVGMTIVIFFSRIYNYFI